MIEYALLGGPIMFLVVSTVLGLLTPKYSWKDDYISELSLGKYGWVQKLNFVICGISILILALLFAGRSSDPIIKIAWCIASLLGITTALAGVWDTDIKRELKLEGKLHNLTYHLGIIGTGLTYLLIGWGYKNFPLILILSWMLAVFDLLFWAYAPKLIKPGIVQRIVIFSAIIWFEIVSLWTIVQ